jgi:tetratricopeptide (TPR) repeat protein
MTARVNYRHLRQSNLNNVLGVDHPAYPIVELASRTRSLALGENAPGPPDPSDNPTWMRWNNLGIAYLDQLQYGEAVAAFNEVVKLRPDYADAYIRGFASVEKENADLLVIGRGSAAGILGAAADQSLCDHPGSRIPWRIARS